MTDYGYSVGGETSTVITNIVEKYDTTSKTWIQINPLLTSRKEHACFSNNVNEGYATTGYFDNFISSTEKFDGNVWSTDSSIPNPRRYNPASFVINNNAYVAGGYTASSYMNINNEYNILGHTWTVKTPSIGAMQSTGFTLSNYGYTAGGYIANQTSQVERYDSVLNSWTTVTSMNIARIGSTSFSIGNIAYTIGGFIGDYTSAVEKYDGNIWTIMSPGLPTKSLLPTSFISNGFPYVCGGSNSSGKISNTYKYDYINNIWTFDSNLINARNSFGAFTLQITTICPPISCNLTIS